MMTAHLLCSLVAVVAAGAAPPRPVDAVILPIRANAMELQDAGPMTLLVEDAFAAAFSRHHHAPVLTAAELRSTLSREAQAQLAGCDNSACFQEVLDALNAPHVVILTLDVSPGLWAVTAAVASRKSGEVLRRREVRSRSLEALLDSLDPMCRSLEGVAALDVEDPQLARRLSTNARGVDALRQHVQGRPGGDPTEAWTSVVTRANQENRLLDLAAGGLFAGAGLVALAAAALHGIGNAVGLVAIDAQPQPPVLWVALPALGVLVLLVVAGMLATGAVAAVVVDMLDLGRIPVGKNGCCRNEPEVRAAGATHPLSWLALGLGLVGLATITLSIPVAVAAFIGGNLLWYGLGLTTVDVAPPAGAQAAVTFAGAAWITISPFAVAILVLAPLLVTATAGLLWLVRDSAHPVVDDQAPVATPAAGQRVSVAN